MRTLTFSLAAFVVAAATFPTSTYAYSDRRTYKFGESNRVIYRYDVDEAYLIPKAVPSFHCVYFAASGKCQAMAKEYNNVRTLKMKVTDRNLYLDVKPTTVSPRAPVRPPLYVRPRTYFIEEYVPTYDQHYRSTHSFDDGVDVSW